MSHNPQQTATQALAGIRSAADSWRHTQMADRLQIIARARRMMAVRAPALAATLEAMRPTADTLVSEVLPLLEAARFLERRATNLLAPRRLGRHGRPAWLAGVDLEIRREPCGAVLILAPANYPLFLPGAQVLQALVAGNGVCVKPAPGYTAPMATLATMLREAGLPDGLLAVLNDTVASGQDAVAAGFDRIVLTGSAETGRAVLRSTAETLTPSTMELSGDDPVFILPEADLNLAVASIAYGTRLNDGRTCIAPRRVYAPEPLVRELERCLATSCAAPPPVIPVATPEAALADTARSPYALGAAVFGPIPAALAFASGIDAGCVVINDIIVPTADPRLPFGGRRGSGFGVTRGAEGLLEMTVVKSIATRRGRFRPHLDASRAGDASFFAALIRLLHADGRDRLSALPAVMARLRSARGTQP